MTLADINQDGVAVAFATRKGRRPLAMGRQILDRGV